MTIRRVDRPGIARVGAAKSRSAGAVGGAQFSSMLETLASLQETDAASGVEGVRPIGDEPSRQQRREQLEQAGELLDTLEALEEDLRHGQGSEEAMARLRETRDHVLQSLSASTDSGEERELLRRTAVLATVELAKSDRGDYR
ncbi:MAG: hypothetical protein HQL51_01815 [Magnetococcales bacterium]|nr:hypothetical protein [Magnetococcales bacterium]